MDSLFSPVSGDMNMRLNSEYDVATPIVVNGTGIKITGFSEIITGGVPSVTESGGTFTMKANGVYTISMERIYENDSTNMGYIIDLAIRVNGAPLVVRVVPVGAAAQPGTPSTVHATSAGETLLAIGDTIEFFLDSLVDPVGNVEVSDIRARFLVS